MAGNIVQQEVVMAEYVKSAKHVIQNEKNLLFVINSSILIHKRG